MFYCDIIIVLRDRCMKKNEKYIVDIIDSGIDGEGIAKIDGQIVFVPFAIVGEKVEILIISVKSKYAIGKVVDVIIPNKIRREPQCPYFKKCGGCDMQHIVYNEQLKIKKNSLITTLRRVGNIENDVLDIVPCDTEYYYRNKIALPIVEQNGKTIIGMYRPNSHNVVEIEDCFIQMPFVKDLLDITKNFIFENKLNGYDEQRRTGDVRHLVARYSGNKLLVTLVVTKRDIPNLKVYFNMLKTKFDDVGLSININNKNTNVILSNETIHLYGASELEIKENGIHYSVPNDSFLQVNNDIRNKIYNHVLNNIASSDIIVDLYSGAGVLTSMLSKKAKHVYGIEIVESAVNSANNLMKENGISNVTNICGDANIELEKITKQLNGNYTIVVDPPRKGLGGDVVNKLCNLTPQKIVYISCSPATLSRDLKGLSNKYEILSITPFDMFPQTKHLETVVVLNKVNK